MMVNVRVFGGLRDLIGQRDLKLDIDSPYHVKAVWAAVEKAYPVLSSYAHIVRFAVNGSLVSAEVVLRSGDDVALLPPMSGG